MQAEGQDYVVLIYERPVPNYYCPVLGIGGETSGRISVITTPTDTDGRGQSRGSNPLDSTQWVSYEPTRDHILT